MSFYFIIQSGPLKGTRHKVKPNLVVGRGATADISIQDPKMSSLHARVQKKADQLYLVDQGSTNKIRVNGEKQKYLLLEDQIIFQLGGTDIQVERRIDTQSEEKNWQELLYDQLSFENFENTKSSDTIKALSPMVELTFLTGLQRNTKWLLGYGPRYAGASSYDLPIIGDSIPEICFSIIPTKNGVSFQTQHSEKVLLNKKNVSNIELTNKDIVSIDNIQIQIQLI